MNKILLEDFESLSKKKIKFESFKNKTILVTGGTGFIGSLLIKSLLFISEKKTLGIKIIALIRDKKKAEEIFKGYIPGKAKLKYIAHDLTSPLTFTDKADFIFHTASVTASKMMIEEPVDTIKISVLGTMNLFDYAVRVKAKKIVYLSSMEIYGTLSQNKKAGGRPDKKTTEDKLGFIDILNVRSSYPEGKRLCENLCIAYASQFNIDISIARLSGVFGAGILKGENRAFASFAKSALKGEDIVLKTKGLSEGNYCYSIEAIEGLLLLLTKGKSTEAYNIVNEKNHTTIKDMAILVAKEIGKDKSKVRIKLPKTNPGFAADTKLKLSAAKLKKLGFAPKVGLKESYIRLAKYLEEEK